MKGRHLVPQRATVLQLFVFRRQHLTPYIKFELALLIMVESGVNGVGNLAFIPKKHTYLIYNQSQTDNTLIS